jgi:hypothetical protein
VDLEFSGAVWFWRGPAPYHFVTGDHVTVRLGIDV